MNTSSTFSRARLSARSGSAQSRKYLGTRVSVGALALLCGFGAVAQAQDARTVYFYSGAGQTDAKSGSWGNGEAAKANDMNYESADSLKVTTRNLNEGIRFDLAQPVDLTPYTAPGANSVVRLRVRFASPFGRGGRGGRGQTGQGGFPGGGQGFPGGGFPGGGEGFPGGGQGFPGGFPGGPGGFPGGPGGEGGEFPGGPFPGGEGGEFGGGEFGGGEGGEFGFGGTLPGMGDDDGRGFGGLQQVSPALANRTSSLPRVLGAPQTRALAQFGGAGGDPRLGGGRGGDPRLGGGMMGGGMMGGMGGMMAMMQRTQISRFQVTMMLDQGTMTGGVDFSTRTSRADQSGWHLLTIPLSSMKATPGASGALRRIVLTTDQEDTWYLGQAALSVDAPKIAVTLRQPNNPPGAQIAEVTTKPGPITLVADVEAGASDVIVEWNFDADNAGAPMMTPVGIPGMGGDPRMGGGDPRAGGDPRMGGGDPRMGGAPIGGIGGAGAMGFGGPRVDARGSVGRFEYPNEEQNYTVEVNVRDRAGKKEPVKTSILVKVRG